MFGNNDSKMKAAATGGLILGLILSSLNYFEYLTKINSGLALFVAYIAGIVYFTKEYGKNIEGFGYGKSLTFGILLSMFAYIILGIYTYVYASFINPVEYLSRINELFELMKQNGFNIKDENTIAMIHNPVFMVLSHIIPGILYGLVISSITSIFTKQV